MKTTPALPFDVRMMNFTSALLLTCLLVTACGLLLWWAAHKPAFAIRQIEVRGDTLHNSIASLQAEVQPHLEGNFFTLDVAATRKLFESAPWVRRAIVQRSFPDQLVVHLQEYQPVAYWMDDEGAQMVDGSGKVFRTGEFAVDGQDMPVLQGPQAQSARILQMYQQLEPLIAPLGMQVRQLQLLPRGHWQFELSNGGVIELGEEDQQTLLGRARRFAATVAEVVGRHHLSVDAIESADLRHNDGYALRLHGITTTSGKQVKH